MTPPMASQHLVFLTLRFPPHGGIGVQRTTSFVRRLAEAGWQVSVITGPAGATFSLEDAAILRKIPDSVRIIRTAYVDPRPLYRAFRKIGLGSIWWKATPSFPQMLAGWIPFAVLAGLAEIRRSGASVLVSSAYPMCAHVSGILLQHWTGIPWVADYRDEWSIRENLAWPTPAHERAARALDRAIVRRADRVITTSPAHTRRFAEEFAEGVDERITTITNGFDDEDFHEPGDPAADGVPAGVNAQNRTRRPFTIAHVGSLLRSRADSALLAALADLVSAGEIPPETIRLRLVGQAADLPASETHLAPIVERTGFVPHAQAIREMRSADLLALVNAESTNILGKTFEYMASGTPILALVRPGPTGDIIREARAGTVLDLHDREGASRAIREAWMRWNAGAAAPAPDARVVRRYERRKKAHQLSDLLDEVLAERRDLMPTGALR